MQNIKRKASTNLWEAIWLADQNHNWKAKHEKYERGKLIKSKLNWIRNGDNSNLQS